MLANDRTPAPAVGACGYHSKHPAKTLLRDAALTAALHADDRRRARLGAGALACFTHVLLLEFQRFFAAGSDFLKRQLDLRFKIEAPADAPPASCPPTHPRAERSAEDVVEHREDVADVH